MSDLITAPLDPLTERLNTLEKEGDVVVCFFRESASGAAWLYEVPPRGRVPRSLAGSEFIGAIGRVARRPYPALVEPSDEQTVDGVVRTYIAYIEARWATAFEPS